MGAIFTGTFFILVGLGVFHIIESDLKGWVNGTLCETSYYLKVSFYITKYHISYINSHVKIIIIVVGHD